MVTCEPRVDQGLMRLNGFTPNGNAVITREVPGLVPVLLRGGARVVTTSGIALDDTEAPLGVPLTYRVAMTGLVGTDRVFQQNLMPTPTFLHGVQGWLAGSAAGRVLSIVTDTTAHSSSVGQFTGSTAGAAPPAAPTLVGHVDSTVFTNSAYTLTPPTTGGTAIAVGDWMILVHQQLISAPVSAPGAVGVGSWTLVDDTINGPLRQLIWSRKRDSTDQTAVAGYPVTVASGANAVGTLLWVRGATQDQIVKAPVTVASGARSQLVTATATVLRPRLTLSFMSAVMSSGGVIPVAGSVSGGTFQYARSAVGNPRTLTVVSDTGADASDTRQTTVDYGAIVSSGMAVQLSLQASASLTNRIVARGKLTALAAATQPYVVTGRIRFATVDLNSWQDIKTFGTWQQVKTTKGAWLGVRGAQSETSDDFLSLFLSIVDPATGNDYITPVKLYNVAGARLNTWFDFSALFTVSSPIPATAELRLFHGTKTREYPVNIWLDEVGITPGGQFFGNPSFYWFDGDTPVPADPVAGRWAGWKADSTDSTVTWTGAVGNSVSLFTGPTAMSTTTTCQLDPDATSLLMPCEPVLISDPVNVTLTTWVGLIHIDALVHPSKQTVHQIINRAAAVAISQIRGWETGQLTVLTMNTDQRNQILSVISAGRVLLLRNPIPDYPENNWFLALGDVTEDRPIPNQRVTIREWTLPFVRVERPSGLIEAGSGRTWDEIRISGTWNRLRTQTQDWLHVLAGDSVS